MRTHSQPQHHRPAVRHRHVVRRDTERHRSSRGNVKETGSGADGERSCLSENATASERKLGVGSRSWPAVVQISTPRWVVIVILHILLEEVIAEPRCRPVLTASSPADWRSPKQAWVGVRKVTAVSAPAFYCSITVQCTSQTPFNHFENNSFGYSNSSVNINIHEK